MSNANKSLDDPATTSLDLYALLSLPNPAQNPSIQPPDNAAIRRAYRKASLLVHPDKAPPEKRDAYAQKFHNLTLAHDILANADQRHIYDARLERENREKREREAYGKKRRKMMEELERRESGGREAFMKSWNGEMDDSSETELGGGWSTPKTHAGTKRTHTGTPKSAEQEREMARLAAEGARRLAEFEEKRRKRRSAEGLASVRVERPDGTPLQGADMAGTPTRESRNGTSNRQSDAPRFSFSPATSQTSTHGQNASPSPSAPGGSLFESTMAKLREAQRRKEAAQSEKEATQRSAGHEGEVT